MRLGLPMFLYGEYLHPRCTGASAAASWRNGDIQFSVDS
jgi:hypothetical protein